MAKKSTGNLSALKDRMMKVSTIKDTDILTDSKYNNINYAKTAYPAMNIALSGMVNGGLAFGITQFASPPKHFKTNFSFLLAKAYMDENPDAMLLFYDCEFGTTADYLKNIGIDTDRVITSKFETIEELTIDIVNQLNELTWDDNVVMLIDSIGNMSTDKEIADAEDAKTTADMTRAKKAKGLFRIITPKLKKRNIPLIAINHTYKSMEMFSKEIVSGGTGSQYNSDNIFFIGRTQHKTSDNKKIAGWTFALKPAKSRFVREGGYTFPLNVWYGKGVDKYSGLLQMAMDAGLVVKPKNGYYSPVNPETGEEITSLTMKENDLNVSDEFWKDILASPKFQEWLDANVKLTNEEIEAKVADMDESDIDVPKD